MTPLPSLCRKACGTLGRTDKGGTMIMHVKTLGIGGAALVAAFSGTVFTAGSADAVTPQATKLTFTNDTTGVKPAGFTSVDSPNISFRSTGTTIEVDDFGVQSRGNAVVAFGATA